MFLCGKHEGFVMAARISPISLGQVPGWALWTRNTARWW